MACILTKGRTEPCKDKVGGIKNIYFVDFGAVGDITYNVTDTDAIDSVLGSPTAYKYEVRGASTFTQNIQSSRDNGTTAFEQVVELTLKRLSASDHKEIKLLSYGRPHILVETQNDEVFLAGLENGMEVTGGTIVTGKAMNDLSGYTLTFTGMEKVPANFLTTDIASAGFTIVAS